MQRIMKNMTNYGKDISPPEPINQGIQRIMKDLTNYGKDIFPPESINQGIQRIMKDTFPPPPPCPHLLSATVRVYSLVAPCRLPDLTSLALLGSVSGQPGLSRGPLPGYKRVSKWRLQLQDSIPFLLLSQKLCTTLHTSASL